MLVTMDRDFGELVHYLDFKHQGVLLLRLEDMNSGQKREIVKIIVTKYGNKIQGKFCVFKKNRLRIK